MNWRRGSRIVFLVSAAVLVACGVWASGIVPAASPSPSALTAAATEPSPSDSPAPTPVPSATPSATAAASSVPAPTATPFPWWLNPPKVVYPKQKVYPFRALAPVGVTAPLVSYGSRSYPVIAITVDDCRSTDAVLADLAVFQRYHVNATWFPIAYVANRSPAVWRKVDKAGFPIGNHTYDHQNLTLETYAAALADIKKGNDVLSAVVGHPIMPFLRPPGGDNNTMVLKAAAAAGERAVVTWDMSDGDTTSAAHDVARLIALGEKGHYGSILLVHANGEYTTKALPWIIDYYVKKGYVFETLGQLFGVPGPVPYPAGASAAILSAAARAPVPPTPDSPVGAFEDRAAPQRPSGRRAG